MKNLFNPHQLAVMASLLLAAGLAQAGAVSLYDNLGATTDGADPLLSYGPLGNSFRTGSGDAGLMLTGISALLKSDSAAVVGDIHATLRTDSASGPGAELLDLGTLSSAAVGTGGFAAYLFSAATLFTLAADTTYWVQLEAATPNAIEWAWSGDLSGAGVAGQSNYSAALGLNSNDVQAPYQMAVLAANTVPEPTSPLLVALGLGAGAWATRRRRA